MSNRLGASDEAQIENKWTQTRIVDVLMDDWGMPAKLRDMCMALCAGGARNSLNSATVGSWLGYDTNKPWADMAHHLGHRPERLTTETVGNTDMPVAEALYRASLDWATEKDEDEDMALMMTAQSVGYGLAKHVAEATLEAHFDNFEMAGADAEFEQIDALLNGEKAQVITTKKDETKNYSAQSWEEKYDADDADDVNFDVYVVAHVSNDKDTLGVATEEVKNEYEKDRANTRAKNAL